ncbi:MAG: hypothetical protein WC723_02680 [Candidatus Omnitrophota bacterium]
MAKRISFCCLAVLLCAVILTGCETCKGVAKGVSEGVAKDTQSTGNVLLSVDDWIRRNLW